MSVTGERRPAEDCDRAVRGCARSRADWMVGLRRREVSGALVRRYYLVEADTEADALRIARERAACSAAGGGAVARVDCAWYEVRALEHDSMDGRSLSPVGRVR